MATKETVMHALAWQRTSAALKSLSLSLLTVVFLAQLGGLKHELTAQQTPAESRAALRVMSFNLRYGSADDGANHWDLRKELLAKTIQVFDPDLLGTQETLELQKQFLDERLKTHESVGAGRDDGKLKGEMTAIWFRRESYELLDQGHFWLSERPNEPGSVSWDSALTRMATWVKLRLRGKPESKPILFVNTHFDHRGTEARRQSAILLRRQITKLGVDCDVVLTGDFNADEDSLPYRALFAEEQAPTEDRLTELRDSYRIAVRQKTDSEGTFNGFQPTHVSGPRIDWIGISRAWRVIKAGIDRTTESGRVPSDHFPVTAELAR